MSRRASIAPTLVFAAVAVVYALTFVHSPLSPIQGDGFYTWLWARSMAFDGDLDLRNDYALCGDPWGMGRAPDAELGPRNQWNPGPAVVWVPMLWLGKLVHLGTELGHPALQGGCRGPIGKVGVFGTVLMALAGLWLSYRLARRYVGRGPSLTATAGVALASPLPYYASILPSYGHAPSAFAVALLLERWDATRGQFGWLRWTGLGALLGLAMLMRPQNAVIVAGPLLEWTGAFYEDVRARNTRRALRRIALGIAFTLAALAVFAPQLYIWKITYGTIFAVPQGPHYMRWGEPSFDGVLFASTGGLLVWTPLLWLSFVGLVAALFRPQTRKLGVPVAVALLATLYVNAAVWDYWGSMGFSNRRFTSMTLPFVFGLALVTGWLFRWAERRPRRFAGAAMAAVVLLFGAWNFAAMRGVASYRIKSWREAPWVDFWKQTYKELAGAVYEHVGNPLAWPASIPFAIRYDAHPKTYDAMRGMSIFYAEYQDRSPRPGEGTAKFHSRLHSQYLIGGFDEESRKVRGKKAAVATAERARMLIPFFIDDVGAVEMRWTAVHEKDDDDNGRDGEHKSGKDESTKGEDRQQPRRGWARVTLVWNGHPLAQHDVPPRWSRVRIELPPGLVESGVNELRWRIAGEDVAFRALKALPNTEAKKRLEGEPPPGVTR